MEDVLHSQLTEPHHAKNQRTREHTQSVQCKETAAQPGSKSLSESTGRTRRQGQENVQSNSRGRVIRNFIRSAGESQRLKPLFFPFLAARLKPMP
jgi:hypothetical protein